MNGVRLSNRLICIADFVPESSRLVDIGTDHALLPLYLITTGRIKRVIAADVCAGPLAAARENIARFGLETAIEIRCSDGFSAIQPGEIDCAVIAGMGGELVCKILNSGVECVKKLKCLVLQPQDAAAAVRIWLENNGWSVDDEELLEENGRMYEVIRAVPAVYKKNAFRILAQLMLPAEVGPVLFARAHPLLARHIENMLSELQRVVVEMRKARVPDNRKILDYELKQIELHGILNLLEVRNGN